MFGTCKTIENKKLEASLLNYVPLDLLRSKEIKERERERDRESTCFE
jgi:hypothetical protein